MSDHSEVPASVDSEDLSLDSLCGRVHKKLTGPLDVPLPVASHRSAASSMLKIRDSMLRGNDINQSSKMALMCAGINCSRRIVCDVEDEGNASLLKTTQTLLFSLLALAEPKADSMEIDTATGDDDEQDGEQDGDQGEEGEEGEECDIGEEGADQQQPSRKRRRIRNMRDAQQLISAWKCKSLADKINEYSDADSSWHTVLKSDAAVSRAALKEAQYVTGSGAMSDMHELSSIFFRCSAHAMVSSMLSSVQPKQKSKEALASFLTLDTVSMLNEANEHQDEKLHALADAAESEAGQAILRDIILSFKLPQNAVGVRRTVGLTRAANTMATKQFPEILNVAHEAAMRGAMWSYESDPDPIHKIASLLAGFALVTVKNKDDIRKGNAFNGRVCLPFFDCPPPSPHVTRMALLPETAEWCVYSLSNDGKPKVKCKKHGYEGFCECLLLVSKLRS